MFFKIIFSLILITGIQLIGVNSYKNVRDTTLEMFDLFNFILFNFLKKIENILSYLSANSEEKRNVNYSEFYCVT